MNRQGLCGWLAGAALLAAGMASAQAETLRFALAAEPYPPFSVKQPDGQWTGFEPDLIHKVCAEMKAQCEIDEENGEGTFIKLHAVPIRRAIKPAILRPVTVCLLNAPQILNDALDFLFCSSGQQAAAGLYEVTRPREMVASEILVAFGGAPRNRQARDVATGKIASLMSAQHGGADAIHLIAFLTS